MLTIYTCLVERHDWRLVCAAVAICVLGCFVSAALWETLDRKRGVQRALWIGIAATTAASSVWATHFVAMLAYDVRLEQGLSVPVTALSFAAAIVLMVPASIAFGRARGDRRWAVPAGAIFAIAVAAMHYTGMSAYRTGAWLSWDVPLVVVSLLAGGSLSLVAAALAGSQRARLARIAMPVCLALSIAFLHFIGMSAVGIAPFPDSAAPADASGSGWLPLATIGAIVLVLTGAAGALWQERAKLRQNAAEMRIARDRAESAAQARSRFLAKMSHELRTPLNGVLGLTQALGQTRLDDNQREVVETILASGNALVAIVDDILDAARLDEKRVVLNPAPFEIGAFVDGIVRLMDGQARAKGLRLEASVAPELSGRVSGDDVRIRQILLNLVGNAIKFTAAGAVRLEAMRGSAADTILFRVSDTGIGIPPDRLDEIFTAFTQAEESTTRRFGGTGLGLTISRELARLMGGDIRVESRPGAGSTFEVDLRLPDAEPAPEAATDPTPAAAPALDLPEGDPGPDVRVEPFRVLVADDARLNRVVVRRLLPAERFATEEAEDGRTACEMMARSRAGGRPFDMILMDVSMPVMDGLAATAEIRRAERGDPPRDGPVRIVGLTAHAAREDRDRCLDAGMDEVLVKPVRRDDLLEALVPGGLAPCLFSPGEGRERRLGT